MSLPLLFAALLAAASPSPVPAAMPVTPPGPVVHIRDYTFAPAHLRVRAGTAVTFVNDDDDAHTATAKDKSWDSAGLGHGDHFTHTFSTPGTVHYVCTLHPYMLGDVVVSGGKK